MLASLSKNFSYFDTTFYFEEEKMTTEYGTVSLGWQAGKKAEQSLACAPLCVCAPMQRKIVSG